MKDYDIDEHTHRYSVWTAARAVQRSFTTTENIKHAIEESGLRDFVEKSICNKTEDFDEFHKKCATRIIKAFSTKEIDEVSYGRSAKIIAIYLKTSIIIKSAGIDKRCILIHPPLDRILLSNLSRLNDLKNLKNKKWTQLSENDYWEIVEIIRASRHKFDWTLEEYWQPVS